MGRPPPSSEEKAHARAETERTWKEQGETSGYRTVLAALQGKVRPSLVRSSLREIKAMKERRRREGESQRRKSVCVHFRDAVWTLDGTHLGWTEKGKCEALVLKDVASGKTIAVSVGGAATAGDAVALLKRARELRGTYPLVLALDNGGPFTAWILLRLLAAEGVTVLRNLPRTPKHNPWAERGIGELRSEAELPESGTRSSPRASRPLLVPFATAAACALEVAATRLNAVRLRARHGYRTTDSIDVALQPWYNRISRERFHAAVCDAIDKAVQGQKKVRAQRLAVREAILDTLQRFGLVTRTWGGAPLRPVKSENISESPQMCVGRLLSHLGGAS